MENHEGDLVTTLNINLIVGLLILVIHDSINNSVWIW